jgi:predicted  nucleic acid-binding Zn-ribbon protein
MKKITRIIIPLLLLMLLDNASFAQQNKEQEKQKQDETVEHYINRKVNKLEKEIRKIEADLRDDIKQNEGLQKTLNDLERRRLELQANVNRYSAQAEDELEETGEEITKEAEKIIQDIESEIKRIWDEYIRNDDGDDGNDFLRELIY